MSDYAELKRLAEACHQSSGIDRMVSGICFQNAATPKAVLEIITENEALRKAVEQSVEWFGRISSGDGSGHADLGRAILRIAGPAMSKEP